MRVLVVADGTRGDVQPMTVLARQLLHEGHSITFAGPPSFREFVEARGLSYEALPFDSEAVLKANPEFATGGFRPMLRAVPEFFVRTTESQLTALPALAKHADFVLVGGIHFGVPSAAEYARIPWRWVLYAPIWYPSNEHPPIVSALGSAPRAVNWVLWQVASRLMDFSFRGPINRHRARLGLAPIHDASEHLLCKDPILAMEPELAPLPPDCPDADVIGYLDPGPGDPLPAALEAFIERGPAPVYIGFGSMPDQDPRGTTRMLADATRDAGVRAVISRGWAELGDDLPEHCMAIGPVSHPRLFPRMVAIVHHGGAGTTAASARAGKPQLIVPHVVDQFFFGDLTHRLGVAVAPLRRTQLTAAELSGRLRALTSDRSLRAAAARLGERIRARPEPSNFSRLLRERAGASLPVLPIGRGLSIAPPSMRPPDLTQHSLRATRSLHDDSQPPRG
jgi:vancomycin aglycone glucosyltransferase